jgi:hypothetical protein
MLLIDRQEESDNESFTSTALGFTKHITIRGAEIAEALTTSSKGLTSAMDIRDAFSCFTATYPPDQALKLLQHFQNRSASVYGEPVPEDCVPPPSQGMNNEVAYMILAERLYFILFY